MKRSPDKHGGVFRFKEYVDNPALLERYLNSQVGRPWDKIYGEIRSNPDCKRSIGTRILLQIERLVATDCYLKGRQVLQPGRFGLPYTPHGLYVHPKTGLLCRPRPRRYERPAPEISRVVIDELHWYEKIDGLWYRLDHDKRTAGWVLDPKEYLHQVNKKQCSKKELKQVHECIRTGRNAYYREKSWKGERWLPAR